MIDYDDLSDEQLLARLAEIAAAVEAPPGEPVLAAARASFALRSLEAELAELVYDSDVDDEALVGVRGGGAPRQLTFEAPGLTVEMEVADEDRRVVGQLVPPQPADVEIRHPGGTIAVTADALGRFSAEGVPAGPVSLRCRSRSRAVRPTATDWVVM